MVCAIRVWQRRLARQPRDRSLTPTSREVSLAVAAVLAIPAELRRRRADQGARRLAGQRASHGPAQRRAAGGERAAGRRGPARAVRRGRLRRHHRTSAPLSPPSTSRPRPRRRRRSRAATPVPRAATQPSSRPCLVTGHRDRPGRLPGGRAGGEHPVHQGDRPGPPVRRGAGGPVPRRAALPGARRRLALRVPRALRRADSATPPPSRPPPRRSTPTWPAWLRAHHLADGLSGYHQANIVTLETGRRGQPPPGGTGRGAAASPPTPGMPAPPGTTRPRAPRPSCLATRACDTGNAGASGLTTARAIATFGPPAASYLYQGVRDPDLAPRCQPARRPALIGAPLSTQTTIGCGSERMWSVHLQFGDRPLGFS